MPKLLLKDLNQSASKSIWPMVWFHGPESFKWDWALQSMSQKLGFKPTFVDGAECSGYEISDRARTLSLFSQESPIIWLAVRNAHQIKDVEALESLFHTPCEKADLPWLVWLHSKDLDQRKKFTKRLIESVACVPCDEVQEKEREPWIQLIAKTQSFSLTEKHNLYLRTIDPWSLGRVNQEILRLKLDDSQMTLSTTFHTDDVIQALFQKKKSIYYPGIHAISFNPDQAIPLVGLLAWYCRQFLAGQKTNPYVAEKIQSWRSNWTTGELIRLQEQLTQLDYTMKQTQTHTLDQWLRLIP